MCKGFTSLLHRAKDKHQISGMKIAQKGPTLSHRFFANNSLIFCKASVQEAKAVVQVIEDYGKAPAQVINVDKFSIFF